MAASAGSGWRRGCGRAAGFLAAGLGEVFFDAGDPAIFVAGLDPDWEVFLPVWDCFVLPAWDFPLFFAIIFASFLTLPLVIIHYITRLRQAFIFLN
jgi:hypothetical protein